MTEEIERNMTEEIEKKSRQTNRQLGDARRAKNDEFYTRRKTVEDELWHYTEHFAGATVYCNCDDPSESEFYKYFKSDFQRLRLRRVIATGYKNLNPDMFSDHKADTAWCKEYDGTTETTRPLSGDGDFRKPESVEILRKADIVCTNPPFSKFREYVAQLVAENKRFLVIGNINGVSYKGIFRLILDGKLWLGATAFNTGMYFGVPDNFVYAPTYRFDRELNGKKVNRVPGVCWFTNLDHKKRHEDLTLTARYGDGSAYPKYDNYDAIEVSRVNDIPQDYAGVMGVPITFLDKWNPDQFEILGDSRWHDGSWEANDISFVNGKSIYRRLLIRNKNLE